MDDEQSTPVYLRICMEDDCAIQPHLDAYASTLVGDSDEPEGGYITPAGSPRAMTEMLEGIGHQNMLAAFYRKHNLSPPGVADRSPPLPDALGASLDAHSRRRLRDYEQHGVLDRNLQETFVDTDVQHQRHD